MVRIGNSPAPHGGASRVRLVRKRAHCAGQASLIEVVIAVAILTIVVWGMVGFLTGGRVMVERTGQSVVAAQIAEERIDRTRAWLTPRSPARTGRKRSADCCTPGC